MPETSKNEMKEALDEFRKAAEESGVNSSKALEMAEKTEKAFEDSEKKHCEEMLKINEERKTALETNIRVKDLEEQLAKSSSKSGVNYKEQPEYKALQLFAKTGQVDHEFLQKASKAEMDTKTLRTDISTSGGVLVPVEMDTQVLKNITEISPVRQASRVRPTSSKTIEIPIRTTIPVATYEGESASALASQPAFANEQLTNNRQTFKTAVTEDMLQDSAFDVEALLLEDAAEAFAFGEGNNFVLGDGVKKPEGFLVNAAIVAGTATSDASGVVDADDIIRQAGLLPTGQNPIYGFNRLTLSVFRREKSSSGGYLFDIGLEDGAPNTINGSPYSIMQDMPDIAAGSKSVIFGDFLRGYYISDRTGMIVVRDELTNADEAIVNFIFRRWNTGQVVLADAFILMTTKA